MNMKIRILLGGLLLSLPLGVRADNAADSGAMMDGTMPSSRAVAILLDEDVSPDLRANVAQYLRRRDFIGLRHVRDALFLVAENAQDRSLKGSAILTLGRHGAASERAVKIYLAHLDGQDGYLRFTAAAAVQKTLPKDERIVPALKAALKAESEEAAQGLPPMAAEFIARALKKYGVPEAEIQGIWNGRLR